MSTSAVWRAWLVSAARHAAAAAGLALVWLVLSGAGAHAATPVGGLTDSATTAQTGPVPASARPAPVAVPDPAAAVPAVAGALTAPVVSSVQAVPTVQSVASSAAPVTGGALSSLGPALDPVLTEVASTASSAVGTVSGTVAGVSERADTVLTPVLAPVAAVLQPQAEPAGTAPEATVAQPAATEASHDSADSAPSSRPDAGPAEKPAAGEAPAPAIQPAVAAALRTAAVPVVDAVIAVDRAAAAVWPARSLPAPATPHSPVLPLAPISLGDQASGQTSGGTGLALAAVAFGLTLMARRGLLLQSAPGRLPEPPAFDPGSTPD